MISCKYQISKNNQSVKHGKLIKNDYQRNQKSGTENEVLKKY